MSEIRVDTISEKTSANGVTIDGLTIKDGGITATTGAIVFNEASADVDFRVESNGNANMLFVDGGNDRVHINGSTGTRELNVSGDNTRLLLYSTNNSTGAGQLQFGDADNEQIGRILYEHDGNQMSFYTNNVQRLLIDSAGKVGIGTASPAKPLHISSADNQPLRVESTDAYSGVELKDNGASTLPPLISGLSDGFKIYAGHGSSRPEVMSIDATGAVTMPLQPAFQLNRQGQGNQTISANSDTTIVLATERFDQNADCASNTFTAPVTGKYKLQAFFYLKDVDTDMNYIQGKITTSNKTYYFVQSVGGYDATMQYMGKNITVLADMDASDTAHIMVYYPSGSDLSVTDETHFSGYLVC